MKKMKKILTIASILAVGLTSCGDWLDLEPENAVTAEKYWLTESDVESAMMGIYSGWIGSASSIWEQSEVRGDMMMPAASYKVDYRLILEGNITSSNSLVSWLKYYTIINNCNLLLERSGNALANDPSYTVTQDSIYHAEARVVRALMYFYLIRLWKDVPYITQAYYDDTVERNVGVSSQMDILNALISDLESVQSEGFLPYSYSAVSSDKAKNKGQVTMYMLKALLADMYRMKGSYETNLEASQAAYKKCVELCDAIIGSGQYALVPFAKSSAVESYLDLSELDNKADSSFYVLTDITPDDWFTSLYVNGNSSESIMELQEGSANYNSSGFYTLIISPSYYAPYYDNLQNTLFPPTEKELALSYQYRDVRLAMNYGVYSGTPLMWKYAGLAFDKSSVCTDVTAFKKNVIIYRLAEIYLMKAEALTQIAMANSDDQSMLLEAYRAVFKVRDRASAVETTDLQLGSGDYMQDLYWEELRNESPIELKSGEKILGTAMEKFVLDEEAREMAYEGRRWFDMLRNAERNSEGKGSCTGGNVSYLRYYTTSDKMAYIAGQMKKADFRYFPYPYQDVSLNDNLEQKPFWGTE